MGYASRQFSNPSSGRARYAVRYLRAYEPEAVARIRAEDDDRVAGELIWDLLPKLKRMYNPPVEVWLLDLFYAMQSRGFRDPLRRRRRRESLRMALKPRKTEPVRDKEPEGQLLLFK